MRCGAENRRGAPWESREFLELIAGIEAGLSWQQLADRHQRTPAAIDKAARRLIPASVGTDGLTDSVDLLACYLRENPDVDRDSLVYAVCPAPLRRSTSGPVQDAESGPADISMLLGAAVASLPRERDRDVLGLRLGLDGQRQTLAEIGAGWGVSGERVRQVQERALRRLTARARYEGTPGAAIKAVLEPASVSHEALAASLLDVVQGDFEIPPRLAARFVLHAAGFSSAVSLEVSSLLPGIERSRKAQLRSLDGDRAPTESIERVISCWLEHGDWPDVVAPPPPATQLSAQRAVNESEIAGLFDSSKLGRTVQYESGLELTMLKFLDRSEQVAYYQEQPAMIPYTYEGRSRSYFPDLFVATTDGRGLLVEVKPTDSMALNINRAKADAGRAWANSRGWGWLVVSDRHTFRQILDHAVPAAGWQMLDSELKRRGALTWRDMIRLRAQHGLTRFDLTAYIVQSGAHLDRGYRITARNA